MTIYLLITDDNAGTQVFSYFKEEEQLAKLKEFCVEHWHESDGDMPGDPQVAYAIMSDGGENFVTMHDIELPIVRDLRAEIGNLLDQIGQMSGMFSDSDGAIAEAVSSANELLEKTK